MTGASLFASCVRVNASARVAWNSPDRRSNGEQVVGPELPLRRKGGAFMGLRETKVTVRSAAIALALGVSAVVLTALPASAATVTSFTPTCGPVGTVVTITGTGFTGADGVIFNGTNATTFNIVSDTSATATVPAGAVTGYILVSTAGSDVSSLTSFTVTTGPCEATGGDHDRTITLSLKNHLTAKGRVSVGDGFIECRSDMTVKIQLFKGGTWKTVGTDTTTGVGNYRVNIADKPGKYRASIAKAELNGGDDTCGAAKSATVNHHH